MSYKVYEYKDKNKEETMEEIEKIQKEEELRKVDSFIMAILSHGKDSKQFYANDEKLVHLDDDIRFKFTDGECPQLKGKPKIFLCNYCRGKLHQVIQMDAYREAPSDMITLHASIDGFAALRVNIGTLFVLSLCETLAEHAHDKEFRELYRILAEKMNKDFQEGTTPELQEFVFKKFYFNPPPME